MKLKPRKRMKRKARKKLIRISVDIQESLAKCQALFPFQIITSIL